MSRRTVTSPQRKRAQASQRKRQDREWANRSGQVLTYQVDPKQLKAEQLARLLKKDPDLLDLLKPDIAQMLRATLSHAPEAPAE